MDTKTLIAESKARFNHNSAKNYLKEKYSAKLIIALSGKKVVLVDTFENPVEVDRKALLTKLTETYTSVMNDWYKEWQELEAKR